jgi:fibronectin type 3 domain-containing protein
LDLFSTDPFDAPHEYYSFYAGPDSLPPPPSNIEITNSINLIEFAWEEIITGKYVSYNIYRSEDGVDFHNTDTTPSSSYSDTTVFSGRMYYYYVTTLFNQWESNPSDTVNALVEAITAVAIIDKLPSAYQLKQNFPNPFNPSTKINYQLPMTSNVELTVYNLVGQKVATLVSERQEAGYYLVEWDATRFSSGVYFYRIQANDFSNVRKMILVR